MRAFEATGPWAIPDPHAKCKPEDHDRSMPDRDGNPDYDLQKVADDGMIGCNDCGKPMYWCVNDGQWHHVDPSQACFLIPAED